MTTQRELLLAHLTKVLDDFDIDAQALYMGAALSSIVGECANALTADPALVEELMPGYVISKAPMSQEQVRELGVVAMSFARTRIAADRAEKLRPIIEKSMREDKGITLEEICYILNPVMPPPRSLCWTPAKLRPVMKALKIDYH
ncbi:MAG: hypothetical protein ACEQSB_00730 [Undibacterium sp.]